MSEEEYMEECERKYIERHTTHIKGYTEEYVNNLQQKVEQLEKEIARLNNIINELEKYIHNELVLDFYNDDMPCELIINKMGKMIKELKDSD